MVLGVHTPETKDEGVLEAVRQKVKELGLLYPIAADTLGATWRVWANQYWPSTYLLDRKGKVRYRWDGELNWEETKGEAQMRGLIRKLLAEKP